MSINGYDQLFEFVKNRYDVTESKTKEIIDNALCDYDVITLLLGKIEFNHFQEEKQDEEYNTEEIFEPTGFSNEVKGLLKALQDDELTSYLFEEKGLIYSFTNERFELSDEYKDDQLGIEIVEKLNRVS